ncbi:hypothetical protein TH2_148 [Shewanella phage Thanatos-2]|nr:hypothetical protein TH2_148 [Shewanella phage Thanatos-2]
MDYKERLANGCSSEDIVKFDSLDKFNLVLSEKYLGCPEDLLNLLRNIYSKVQPVKLQATKKALISIKEWTITGESDYNLVGGVGICQNFTEIIQVDFNTGLAELEDDFKKFKSEMLPPFNMFVYDLSVDILAEVLHPVFKEWPKYSGDRYYPVPYPYNIRTASIAYRHASEHSTLWTGEYGDLRKEFLYFLIDHFSKF